MAVCGCPDIVITVLQAYVSRELGKVRQAKFYENALNAAVGSITVDTVAKIEGIVDIIPDPIGISFTDLVSYITCPLFPTALAIKQYEASRTAQDETALLDTFQGIDPETQKKLIEGMARDYSSQLESDYRDGIQGLDEAPAIGLAQQYQDELKSIDLDADSLAIATTAATQVQTTCPAVFAGSVFEEFLAETTDFSINAGVSSGVGGGLGDVLSLMAQATVKLEGWKQIAAGGATLGGIGV